MAAPEVLVIGDANPDVILRGDVVPRFGQAEQLLDAADIVLGGSAAIVACGLARLGVPTALAAMVGRDVFGDFVREELSVAGVDTRWLVESDQGSTALTVVLSAGDRAILTHPGVLNTASADLLPDLAAEPGLRHVHSASYFLLPQLAPQLPAIFASARKAGLTTSLDTNWDPEERWHGVADALPYVSAFLPNAAELSAVAHEPDLEIAARRLTVFGCSVALKAGSDGGILWTPDGARYSAPITPVEVVDTTGAGDAFDAGYISGVIAGLDPQACLNRAVACGSLSTRASGGTAAQATMDDLLARGFR